MMRNLNDHIRSWDTDFRSRFPARIRAAQKERFLSALEGEFAARGFQPRRLEARYLLKNRLLVTHCPEPDFIFTAHYDTPTIMPFWIGWVYQLFGHTRQISGTIFLIVFLYLPSLLAVRLPDFSLLFWTLQLFLLLSLLLLALPNPSNREDNTSGVIGLLALAEWLKDRPDMKERVQFAVLDNEEWGLLGSAGLKARWDSQGHRYRDAAIINLDCISRGTHPLLVYNRDSRLALQLLPFIETAFPKTRLVDMGPIPLSDNYTFREQGALDISLAEPSWIPGGYHIPRIHSPQDNDFNAENTENVVRALTKFLADQKH